MPTYRSNAFNVTVIDEAATTLQSSVTQYGITWTFDTTYTIGQFVTGDWFVVDPGAGVTINSVTPTPGGGRNGSILNPSLGSTHPFDDRTPPGYGYSTENAVSYPATIVAGDALISTESLTTQTSGWNGDGLGTKSFVWGASILTCVSSVPFVDQFRPSYLDRAHTVYRTGQMDTSILPGLTPPASMLSTYGISSYFERSMQRPWILFGENYGAQGYHPHNNMRNYHRDIGKDISRVMAFMMTDEVTSTAINYFCQLMIDYYQMAIINSEGDSAFWFGPVALAGMLLQNSAMYRASLDGNILQSVSRDYEKLYYVNDRASLSTSAVLSAGQMWTGNTPAVCFRKEGPTAADGPGREWEHLHPSEWSNASLTTHASHLSDDNNYRQIDSEPHVGMVLARYMMSSGATLATYWNHGPTFDYVDRWMSEPSSVYTGTGYSACSGMTSSGTTFIDDMWGMYR